MSHRNHKSRRQERRKALRLLTILATLCQAELGCVYHDHEGEGGGTPSAPTTHVFDYRVITADTGATLTSGCAAAWFYDDLSNAIVAKVPLGTEYLVELTNGRAIEGTLDTYDVEYFCAAPYSLHDVPFTNPVCYRVSADSRSELIEATLLDSTGQSLTSSSSEIHGASSNIERFKMKTQVAGSVTLTSDGPPCNGVDGNMVLLTVESI